MGVTLRAGDWTCSTHGRITPTIDDVVPACPACGAMALRVRMHRAGYPEFVEPAPPYCAGPDRHRLGLGQVGVGFHSCPCPPVVAAGGNGHRTWRCYMCGDVQQWPPHMDPAELGDASAAVS